MIRASMSANMRPQSHNSPSVPAHNLDLAMMIQVNIDGLNFLRANIKSVDSVAPQM